jgi:hypothetical protein
MRQSLTFKKSEEPKEELPDPLNSFQHLGV